MNDEVKVENNENGGASSSSTANGVSETKEVVDSKVISSSSSSMSTKKVDGFEGFLQILYSYFRGDVDLSKYEETCRSLVGPNAFILTTIEKHITNVSKSLSTFVHDKSYLPLMKLYKFEQSSNQQGNISPKRYILHAKHLFQNHQIELFRIQFKKYNNNGTNNNEEEGMIHNKEIAYGEVQIEFLGSTMKYPKHNITQIPSSNNNTSVSTKDNEENVNSNQNVNDDKNDMTNDDDVGGSSVNNVQDDGNLVKNDEDSSTNQMDIVENESTEQVGSKEDNPAQDESPAMEVDEDR
jgi:hypothetical protein